jgi:hypothetical protein
MQISGEPRRISFANYFLPADLHTVRELINGNIDVAVSSWNPNFS